MAKGNGRSDGQVLKGLLDTLVLQLLADGDSYGFAILQTLGEQLQGDGGLELKETTLYPLLHRLEEKGHLEAYFKPGERGTPRKYYRLTKSGHAHRRERIAEWQQVSAVLTRAGINNGHNKNSHNQRGRS